jgi:tyrosinase
VSNINSSDASSRPRIFVSQPLKLNVKTLDKNFYRADLEFHGVDHSGASYVGHVFVNNEEADENTSQTAENGYVGSFSIFGHGRCFGDEGHCEMRKERLPFDYRPSHPLTPAYKRVIITAETLKEIAKETDEFVVSIVPVLAGGSKIADNNVVKLDSISIVTYNK